jgi:hypothetical protein
MSLLAGCSYSQYHIVHTYFTPFPTLIELLLNAKLIGFAPNLGFSQVVDIL